MGFWNSRAGVAVRWVPAILGVFLLERIPGAPGLGVGVACEVWVFFTLARLYGRNTDLRAGDYIASGFAGIATHALLTVAAPESWRGYWTFLAIPVPAAIWVGLWYGGTIDQPAMIQRLREHIAHRTAHLAALGPCLACGCNSFLRERCSRCGCVFCGLCFLIHSVDPRGACLSPVETRARRPVRAADRHSTAPASANRERPTPRPPEKPATGAHEYRRLQVMASLLDGLKQDRFSMKAGSHEARRPR